MNTCTTRNCYREEVCVTVTNGRESYGIVDCCWWYWNIIMVPMIVIIVRSWYLENWEWKLQNQVWVDKHQRSTAKWGHCNYIVICLPFCEYHLAHCEGTRSSRSSCWWCEVSAVLCYVASSTSSLKHTTHSKWWSTGATRASPYKKK